MKNTYTELEAGFSTADTQGLQIQYADRSLVVSFADWNGERTIVHFYRVSAYRWSEDEYPAAPDRVYLVEGSEWLQSRSTSPESKHYALGFCGEMGHAFLEVIASDMTWKKPNKSPETRTTSGPVSA